jgi:macrolide transport system ATP-binding/permease protein
MALLQQLNHEGVTIVLVTHEHDIALFASRIISFRDGVVVEDKPNTPTDAAALLNDSTMNFSATLRIALLALRINKMRSALTMLGIIIGVAAVIVMIAVGNGAQARVEEQIKSLGSNIIMVLSGSMMSGGARGGSGSQPTIFEEDAYRHDARSR